MASGRDCASLKFVVIYLPLSRWTRRRFLIARLPQAKRWRQYLFGQMRLTITTFLLTVILTIITGQFAKANDSTKYVVTVDVVDTTKKAKGIEKIIERRIENCDCDKHEKQKGIFDYLAGLLTPIIGLMAFWIARQQWIVQRYKAKFDLFERRMKIYEGIREVLGHVHRDGSLNNVNMPDFYMHVRHSKFLFDRKTTDYIAQIDEKVMELHKNGIFLFGDARLPVGDERTRVAESNSAIITWLVEQIEVFDDKFSSFMEINRI